MKEPENISFFWSLVVGLSGILVLISGWWTSKITKDVDRLKNTAADGESTRLQLEKLSAEVHSLHALINKAEAQLMRSMHDMQIKMMENQRQSLKEVYAHIATKEEGLRGEIRENRRKADKAGGE